MNSAPSTPATRSLASIAKRSLEANIVTTSEGPYLAAGSHQFGSLWTRDFCLAARGLLAIGRDDVVRHHVTHLLSERREDGLIARVLECVPSWKRVVAHTALRFLPENLKQFPMKAPLTAEHLGEHKTISIDSNALLLRTAADLQKRAPDEAWLVKQNTALQATLDYCLMRTKNGTELVSQGRFEDWQDSVAREGKTLFVNAMFADAFSCADTLKLKLPESARAFSKLLVPAFIDAHSGVLKSHANLDLVSLDGNILMINEPALRAVAPNDLYSKLKQHPIWSRAEIPGSASYPDYPIDWISWTTKVVGLRHYHDELVWSWLSGLAAKAALISGDQVEAERIFAKLTAMAERDQAVAEVYRAEKNLPPVKTLLYVSEMPFSWGSGCILEAIEASAAH